MMVTRVQAATAAVAIACAMGVAQTALSFQLGDTHVVLVPAESVLAYGPDRVEQAYAWATSWYEATKWGLALLGGALLMPRQAWVRLRLALRR